MASDRRTSRVRRCFLVIAGLLSVLLLVSSAGATNRLADKGHWIRDGTAVSQVYFIDHTGVKWPVNAATIEWNKSARVGVYYLSPGSNCPFHCVHVYEVFKPSAGYYGAAFGILGPTAVDGNNHWNHNRNGNGPIYINLNTSVSDSLTQNQRQGVACQEEGHVLGLDHRQYTNDCMYDKDDRYFPRYPSDHDYSVLANIYDH